MSEQDVMILVEQHRNYARYLMEYIETVEDKLEALKRGELQLPVKQQPTSALPQTPPTQQASTALPKEASIRQAEASFWDISKYKKTLGSRAPQKSPTIKTVSIEELKREIEKLQREKANLIAAINGKRAIIKSMQETIASLRKQVKEMRKKVKALKKELSALQEAV